MRAGERNLGAVVLADRVSGAGYTVEELELLACIGDQVTSVLLNLRLASEVAQAKELEAFRTMSAFFVHDLKNAAASLNLMLKNLPVHFDDPAFRADALRGVGNTAKRIDDMIARLSALRQRPDFTPVESDLNQLVSEALDRVDRTAECRTDEGPSAAAADAGRSRADSERRDQPGAQRAGGRGRGRPNSRCAPSIEDGHVVLSVADNGCGMTPAFVKESLFRPFQSTKKKGLGIGLFQSRTIVQAHGGRVQVESEAGQGHDVSREPSGQGRAMTKPRLLIVDDDEDIRTQMKWALAQDYDVALAGDRAEAVAAFTADRPLVTLLDLGLPPRPNEPEEGLATLSTLLALDPLAKVIIVSGQGDKENALRAVGAGAYDFLCKPVDMDELKLVLQRCVYVAAARAGIPRHAAAAKASRRSRACWAPARRCRPSSTSSARWRPPARRS